MKILWIANTIFPKPSVFFGFEKPVFGGWMYGLAESLSKELDVELAVATTYNGSELKNTNIDGVNYYLLPCKNKINYDKALESLWEKVCEDFQPDIIHIHGTEFAHGLACMRKLPNLKYVVSIQGLVGIYSRYYFAGIPFSEILINVTFRDLIKRDTIFQAKKMFEKRGDLENEYLFKTKHAIGRTNWDFVHTKTVNSDICYHFCNESLRDGFYTAKKWKFENCEPYTIFLSQAGYPIKGLHQVIKAISILKKEYPSLKIRLGGGNIVKRKSMIDKIKRTGYGKYIGALIRKHSLEKDIIFLGALSEEKMIIEYQRANVFICPSSIENSPNSLGEAQLIGVPVIASYVGGTPDMIEDHKTGLLYRFEEVEMLSENIRQVFNDSSFAFELSESAIKAASSRHDRKINLEKTISIYNRIINL